MLLRIKNALLWKVTWHGRTERPFFVLCLFLCVVEHKKAFSSAEIVTIMLSVLPNMLNDVTFVLAGVFRSCASSVSEVFNIHIWKTSEITWTLDGDRNFSIVMSYKPPPFWYIFMLIKSRCLLPAIRQMIRERRRKYLYFVRFIYVRLSVA